MPQSRRAAVVSSGNVSSHNNAKSFFGATRKPIKVMQTQLKETPNLDDSGQSEIDYHIKRDSTLDIVGFSGLLQRNNTAAMDKNRRDTELLPSSPLEKKEASIQKSERPISLNIETVIKTKASLH